MTDKGGREVTSKVGVRGARLEKYRKKEGLADEEKYGVFEGGILEVSNQPATRVQD
jgi:hypothetical protein